MIEIRHLRHFVAVVEAGGIRQAARVVHISASSILRSIQILEDHYGVALLERGKGNPMLVTPSGTQLLDEARTLISDFDDIATRLHQTDHVEAGTLRVALSPAVAAMLQTAIGARLIREYPEVELVVHTADASGVLDLLLAGKVDVGCGYGKLFALQTDLETFPLYNDQGLWWTRADHPLRGQQHLTIADLMPYPIISQHLPSLYREHLLKIMTTASQQAQNHQSVYAHQTNDYDILLKITESTDAVLLGARLSVLASPRSSRVRRLEYPVEMPGVDLVVGYRRHPAPSPLARRFVALLQEESAAIVRELSEPIEAD